ncbi:hypothetical protein [Mangrovibacterium lignilyticum]|uniref:hypothetical protein n=1 Tax=Mangrovibacterium lignilyticum TaxID=2668052 RepID=UPI0013D79418|nr:hypothetical protein [Mangrovibacterium lignilyticum]
MDIKNFFHKILSTNKGPTIPELVKESFFKQFQQPLNIEWQVSADQFEAVFYKNEMEHIARFNREGQITCLKTNISLEKLPEAINETAQKHGELMNAISIACDESLKYELIVRDSELTRYFLLLSKTGEVLDKEKL